MATDRESLMLRNLSQRLTYANVMATLGVFIALGGSAYAVNTVNSTDIVDGQVKSVDIGNNEIGSSDVKDNSINTFDVHSFVGADVVDSTITSADVAEDTLYGDDILEQALQFTNSLASSDICNGCLKDEDVGEYTAVNFAADIGTVGVNSCVERPVTGFAAALDHLLLTPSRVDADGGLLYDARFEGNGANTAWIHVCNFTNASVDDGTTHFNLLGFDGL